MSEQSVYKKNENYQDESDLHDEITEPFYASFKFGFRQFCNQRALGFVAFLDPPKQTAKESLALLAKEGIELKILTGDNELVTRKICEQLGFEIKGVVLGTEIAQMHDDALARVVEDANVFARVTPVQKDRLINLLKNNGHVVGFMGDGINDAPSLKTSDVGVSVNNAVDVARVCRYNFAGK